MFAGGQPLIRLVESGAPVEAAFLIPLDDLILTFRMSLQELHEIERLLHLKGEIRVLVHHLESRDDDIVDPFGPAVLRSVHPGDVLMGRLDYVDLAILEHAPILLYRRLDAH